MRKPISSYRSIIKNKIAEVVLFSFHKEVIFASITFSILVEIRFDVYQQHSNF
jgi:hypothetical protein